jgi:hypothetical protein
MALPLEFGYLVGQAVSPAKASFDSPKGGFGRTRARSKTQVTAAGGD